MQKKKINVFGSKQEEVLFEKLDSFWSKDYNLYPNLPFSNIIDLNEDQYLDVINFPNIKECKLSDKEKDFLYKTSVDYTLCNKNNCPLLSIDYDGIGQGFSKDGAYHYGNNDHPDFKLWELELRKKKFDLKLRLCIPIHYPYIIIAANEGFAKISQKGKLTILDSIIGQILGKITFHETITDIVDNSLKNFTSDKKNDPMIQEYLQEVVLNHEIHCEVENDPIYNYINNLRTILRDKNIIVKEGMFKPIHKLIDGIEHSGFKAEFNCNKKTFANEVIIRDIGGYWGISMFELTKNMLIVKLYEDIISNLKL